MENIMLLILGVFISVMGIINIKGNISTILVGLCFMLYGQIKYNKGIF